jgi:hypothetical protein
MKKVEIRASKRKSLSHLIAIFGFVACGVFFVVQGKSVWVGWSSICFFGSMIPSVVGQLINSRPRLIIDEFGVVDRTLTVGKFLWFDIDNAYLININGNHFICLVLKDTNKYLERANPFMRNMAIVNRKLGFTPFSLNLSGVDADPYQVLDIVIKSSQSAKKID